MERWEDQIDVDDSDLYSILRPQSLPSCPSSPQPLPQSLHPCSQIPCSSQTLDHNHPPTFQSRLPITIHETPGIEEGSKLPTASTPCPLIPGPAGAIQAAKRRQSVLAAKKRSSFEAGEGDDREICLTEDEEEEFKLNPWLCAQSFLGKDSDSSLVLSEINANRRFTERIPQVVGIVKHCRRNGLGDLFLTLKDPTGSIGATVHRKVLSEGNYCRDISVGCVLILNQVVAFHPPRSQCYLNITLNNLAKLISKDCGPPEKQIVPPFAIIHGVEGNVKQLQTKLHEGGGSCSARKTVHFENRRKFKGERTIDGRKAPLPASETLKSGAQLNESTNLISRASIAEWTDEQLEKLFSEYEQGL